MAHQLADALKASGVLDKMAQEARSIKNQPKFHQIFRLSLTRFEIPVAITVECDNWEEGLSFIRKRELNSSESPEELEAKLQSWSVEPAPQYGKGNLIYYRNYRK